MYKKLKDFLERDMRMAHIYQPVMIKTLLKHSGSAEISRIAQDLLSYDTSQKEYYELVTKNMVGKVLTKNRKITSKEGSKYYLDGFDKLSKDQQKEIENLQMQITNLSMGNSDKSTSEEFEIGSTKVSCSKVFASNIGALRKAGDLQRTKLGKGLVILGSIIDEKGSIIIMATDGLDIDAGELAKLIAKETDGGGGGNKFSAQVGIKDLENFELFFKDPNKILDNLD